MAFAGGGVRLPNVPDWLSAAVTAGTGLVGQYVARQTGPRAVASRLYREFSRPTNTTEYWQQAAARAKAAAPAYANVGKAQADQMYREASFARSSQLPLSMWCV